jgi:DNA polymerase-3 subunit epsilon
MDDVLALQVVFDDLSAQLAALGITTLGDVLRYARGFSPGEPEPAAPDAIAEALREGRRLRIVYSSKSLPQPTERIIRPIEIVSQHGVLFLRAYCYLREDLRVFVIEKIAKFEIEG